MKLNDDKYLIISKEKNRISTVLSTDRSVLFIIIFIHMEADNFEDAGFEEMLGSTSVIRKNQL